MAKKTVQDLASELALALVSDKRQDGSEFVKLKDESPEWMTEVIHQAHGDAMLDDTIYRFIDRAVSAIADASEWTDDLEEAIQNMEPDIYTSDLTAWLNERNDHVHYLTEVLRESGGDIRDGFQLLGMAQQAQIHEVGYALLEALREQVDGLEDEPEDEDDFTDPFLNMIYADGGNLTEEKRLLLANWFDHKTNTPNNDYWWQYDRNVYPFGT